MDAAAPTDLLAGPVYRGYAYSYPHKTAHRPLARPVALRDLWSRENRDALFLYLHVPFCPRRCGYCNLFSAASCDDPTHRRYVDVLRRQARRVAEHLGEARFARLAIGGGTPSAMSVERLADLFDVAREDLGVDLRRTPTSFEVSPATTTDELCALLADRHVDRLSVGIQSFLTAECDAIGRPQEVATARRALDTIRRAGPLRLNVDLIYGIPGQTVDSWLASLREALLWRPEELYLYPLYVRPQTALAGRTSRDEALCLDAYRAGRDFLRSGGYEQLSMRLFRRPGRTPAGPAYSCQEDGMVGLGCGPRSYTRALHYSGPYAVGQREVRTILDGYLSSTDDAFDDARFGIRLDGEDQRRRFVIQSLLQCDGLRRADYIRRFSTDVLADLPELERLGEQGLAVIDGAGVRLTEAGLERSDAVGPWLYSRRVRQRMQEYRWR